MDKQDFNSDQIKESLSALQKFASVQPGVNKDEKKKKKKKEPSIVLEANGIYILIDGSGNEIESGQAKFILDEEKISIFSEKGQATTLLLRDISEFIVDDFKINLVLVGGGKAVLSELGYQYEDFARVLNKLRHEISQKELLMKEGGIKGSYKGSYSYRKGGEEESGEAKVEVSDTGIVIKPKQGNLIRISYAEIDNFSDENYEMLIVAESFEVLLSGFGEYFDFLSNAMKESLNELSLKTQLILKEFLPELDPLTIKKASEFLRDGQAVSREKIDKISSSIWIGLEKKMVIMGIKESYDYLMSLSKTKQIFFGIKRDLMGDLTGEYVWFLIPVNSQEGNNFIVMEAASTIEGGGKATYFFKIAEKEDIEELVKKINRCMIAINFRREPIYLKAEDLENPKYLKYKTAINRIPELKFIRQLFVGRVIHAVPEEWKKNVNNLMAIELTD